MKYLLDTHVAIWSLAETHKITPVANQILSDESNALAISIASVWEVAIKVGNGKLDFPGGTGGFLDFMHENEIEILPISEEALKQVESLPAIHRDPFDRLLVATALADNLTLLTADENIHQYPCNWVW